MLCFYQVTFTNVFFFLITVTYPLVNLDGHVGFRVTEKSLKTELRGKFDKYSAQLLVQGEINTKKEGDYNAEIRVSFLLLRNLLIDNFFYFSICTYFF